MKSLKITLLGFFVLLLSSCHSDDTPTDTAVFAVPTVKSLSSIRNSVSVTGAMETDSEGKIYVSQKYLFYIAKEQGVHVIDNHNAASPQNIAFINIAGVHDIAVKGDFLYADNFVDLLVFNISDPSNIQLVRTVENSINFYPVFPDTAEFYDYEIYPETGEIITGFTLQTRARPEGPELLMVSDATATFEASNGGVGTGGSYAKFQINNNALYTVDSYQLNVFNIAEPINAVFDKAVYTSQWFGGGVLETLFKQGNYLFAGATNGMHIIDASDEFNPFFVSGFSHATACDPVVVAGNTAYITVRGGTTCGAIEDQVNVIDIADIANPSLVSTYLLSQPYGLGIRENVLYVCCGNEGLKVFDASNGSSLQLKNSYALNVKDVIPLDDKLITVGDNKITQYTYGPDFTLAQLSVVNF
jgi:hypothetical protein